MQFLRLYAKSHALHSIIIAWGWIGCGDGQSLSEHFRERGNWHFGAALESWKRDSKDVAVGGECSGSRGCGSVWKSGEVLGFFKQVMCFVTKSLVCEAQEFRSWNSSWPDGECVRLGLTGEECTQYRQPLAFKCENVKHAWCEISKPERDKTLRTSLPAKVC